MGRSEFKRLSAQPYPSRSLFFRAEASEALAAFIASPKFRASVGGKLGKVRGLVDFATFLPGEVVAIAATQEAPAVLDGHHWLHLLLTGKAAVSPPLLEQFEGAKARTIRGVRTRTVEYAAGRVQLWNTEDMEANGSAFHTF